jgi:hypothetical protein
MGDATTAEPSPGTEERAGTEEFLAVGSPSQVGLLFTLGLSALYGVPYNVLLMSAILHFRQVWTAMHCFVFALAAVTAFNGLVVALLLAYRLMGIVKSTTLEGVCTAFAAGMLFTNCANMLLIPGMAVVRFRTLVGRRPSALGIGFCMAVMAVCGVGISVYYVASGGVMQRVCVDPLGAIPQGRNRLFFILAAPFFVSVVISLTSYVRIYVTVRSQVSPVAGTPPSLLRPMLLVFITYVVSYLPVILLAVVRRKVGMDEAMAHAHLWVAAFNCAGSAALSTAYSLPSAQLRKAIGARLLTPTASREIV